MQTAEALLVGSSARSNRFPPIFVLGAPRCGTTLVALHLFNTFRFAYFPNVAKENPRHPYLSARRALRRHDGVSTYESRYGLTSGPLGLSDGWDVLERWFPNYRETRAGEVAGLESLRHLVARFEDLFGGPFLCKNNANSARIEALDEAFPDAFFVHVRRSLPEAAASLLKARAKHGVPLGKWWSAAPPAYVDHSFASELEQVVATITGIDHTIEERMAALTPERWTSIDYAAFCQDPSQLVDWTRESYERAGLRLERLPGTHPSRFEASELQPEERSRLQREIAAVSETLRRS